MISTHILDTSNGTPAQAVRVSLEKRNDHEWIVVDTNQTNDDGRIVFNSNYEAGVYRLLFEVEEYFARTARPSFFMTTPVVFKIDDVSRKYHVPLLLNPYGYSTYRGS
ncbi:MAG: hydroxyisourate hydrolase [Bacteriovoracaceae bacterium]